MDKVKVYIEKVDDFIAQYPSLTQYGTCFVVFTHLFENSRMLRHMVNPAKIMCTISSKKVEAPIDSIR